MTYEVQAAPGAALSQLEKILRAGVPLGKALGQLYESGALEKLGHELLLTVRQSRTVAKDRNSSDRDVHFTSNALADFGRLSDSASTREALTDFANAGRLPELAAAISGLAGRTEAEKAASPAGAIADAERERDESARLADMPGIDRDLRNHYIRKSSDAARRVNDLKGVS